MHLCTEKVEIYHQQNAKGDILYVVNITSKEKLVMILSHQ